VSLNAGDLRRAHERIGRADELVEQRRALYAIAIELGAGRGEPLSVDPDILDNPVVRGHLGEVLGGRVELSRSELRPLAVLVAPGYTSDVAGHSVRLASAPTAHRALDGVVRRIGDELQRQGDENFRLELLTTKRREELDEAHRLLVDGVRLAVRLAPDLALDLLPHVTLFAVVDGHGSGRLGSASAREFPGIILVPQPRTALEVAEALVHEGAHTKFFDMATTRRILGPLSHTAPRFARSWAPAGAPDWPLEQSLAAWHAYRCLEAFAHCVDAAAEDIPLHDDSLLPEAAVRADEIGEWLRRCGPFLGADAHDLIGYLDGSRPYDAPPIDEADLRGVEEAADALTRPVGSRTLVAKRGAPPELYWCAAQRC
jgi:hypothetical protein